MSLILTYKNNIGTVTMQGGGNASSLRITGIEGLGLVAREFNTAVYAGHDGQETLGSRALARSITISIEAVSDNVRQTVVRALDIFSQSGMLYINDGNLDRRIYCSQVRIPDVKRILHGQIATFAVQFVCDNPFFEDAQETVVPLYRREKLLSSPFSLPTMLGKIIVGGSIEVYGALPVEPIIKIYYPVALECSESIIVINETTGSKIKLDYTPWSEDTVIIDIKNRKITSANDGNIINYLSADTFLGDFVLEKGVNVISVNVGDVTSGFTVECRYNNLYNEAVIV